MKIYPTQYPDIIKSYSVDLVPMISLATKYSVSRMAIWKILKSAGIDTKKGSATQISTICAHCGNPVKIVRSRFKNSLNHFCSKPCFYAWLNRNISPLIKYRHGLRLARKEVSKYFNLLGWNIVHHEDRNQTNNTPDNLRVFLNQASHVRYHRGFKEIPIWNGREPKKHNNPPMISKYLS